MNPDDIPTAITDLADTCPFYLKSATVPVILAHFWPAIREHFITEITADLDELHDDIATPDYYRAGLRYASRRIRRAEDGGY